MAGAINAMLDSIKVEQTADKDDESENTTKPSKKSSVDMSQTTGVVTRRTSMRLSSVSKSLDMPKETISTKRKKEAKENCGVNDNGEETSDSQIWIDI